YLLKREMENFGSKVSEICDFSSLSDGSTANIIHYSTDQILTIGNCGDSRAVLFIIGDDGNFYYKRLTNDHDPEDIIEKARVENIEAGRVSDGRIWGDNRIGLSLSRSFGDLPISADRQRLISQEVDIYQYDIAKIKQKYGAGSKIFLMNSCDGMYDNSRSNEKIYAAALKNWHEQESLRMKWKNNPAEYLRDFSMALGSVDNITTCFFDITLAPTQPIINGIFDGHCGDRVSSLAADYFGKTLLQENSIIHFQNQNFVNNFGQTMLSLTTDERGVITKESFVINPNLEDLTTKDLLGNSYYDQDYITLLTTAYALEKKFKTEEISGKNLLVKKSNIVYFEADPDNSFSAEKISQATERVLDILTNERPEITQAQIFFLIDIKNNWQVVEINFSKTAENKFLVNQIYFNCEQDQINSHQELIQNSLGNNQLLILNLPQNNVILPIEAKNSGPLICQYLGTRLGEINADHQTIIFSPEELLNLRVEQIKLASKNLGLQYAYDFYISDCNPRSEDLLDFESDFSDSDNKEQKLNYSSNNSELKKPSAKTLKNNQHEHHN
ncbi:MAG: PP2C family protein-serine/threonine phosphatase, partial [Rickettsiales bacterium]|nr:PP2C family protein-serine/threonine phosphatase [Rickettsiales bacterium]